jgi:hypothetical protein
MNLERVPGQCSSYKDQFPLEFKFNLKLMKYDHTCRQVHHNAKKAPNQDCSLVVQDSQGDEEDGIEGRVVVLRDFV